MIYEGAITQNQIYSLGKKDELNDIINEVNQINIYRILYNLNECLLYNHELIVIVINIYHFKRYEYQIIS